MPESSPAGPGLFWKGFFGGATPGPPGSVLPPDMSPVKGDGFQTARKNGFEDRDVMSSSPPPIDHALGNSPSKPARDRSNTAQALPPIKQEDYTNEKRQNSGGISYNTGRLNGLGLSETNANTNGASRLSYGMGAPPSLTFNTSANAVANKDENKDDEDDDDDGGIDLAKGFAPISSFSSQRGSGMTTKS